jgi:hypothetical protein
MIARSYLLIGLPGFASLSSGSRLYVGMDRHGVLTGRPECMTKRPALPRPYVA